MSVAQPHPGCKADTYCRKCGDMWCEGCSCYCFVCPCPCHGDEAVVHDDTEGA